MHRRFVAIGLLVAAALLTRSANTRAQNASSPREQLQQYVAQLQQNPNDNDLREKIIKLVLTIKPAPGMPDKDKVLELEGEAKGALKAAQIQSDFSDAVKLFQKALLLAPWDADLNYNFAKAQEMAKQYDDAIASYKLYLLASPDAKDHDAVLEKIGELKYAAGQSRQEAGNAPKEPQAQLTQQQAPHDNWLKSLDGACYVHIMYIDGLKVTDEEFIRGQDLWHRGDGGNNNWYTQKDHYISSPDFTYSWEQPGITYFVHFIITGQTITQLEHVESTTSSRDNTPVVYRRVSPCPGPPIGSE